MKTIKRILSVVLTLAMLMSLVCVPGYAADTNEINLAIEFSASGDRTNPVTSVEAGTEFTMWVTFDGNPTELADSIQGYGLLIGYDPAKLELPYGEESARDDGLAKPLMFQPAFTDGVMYASWASTSGIVKNRVVQAEGLLFALDVKATETLSTNDLLDIVFIEEATGGDQEQTTKLINGNEENMSYSQIFTMEREVTTIDLAIEFSEAGNRAASVTSVAAEQEFTMWITFAGNPAALADSIQGYGLLIQYDPAKLGLPYGEKSARDDGLAIPLMFQPAFTDGVMYAAWASTGGLVKDRVVQTEGLLFALDVKATTDLTTDDLLDIVFIKEATGSEMKQTTKLIDGNEELCGYVQIPTVGEGGDEEPELIEIKDSDFTFVLDDVEYTGSAIEPKVTSILPADAYEVAYSNNVEVGTATITVTGIGAYTGTIVKNFTIKEKEVVDNTNGKTIDLAIEFSEMGERDNAVTSVAAGTDFTMWVTFAGNPTELVDSIQGYGLLIGYDPAKLGLPYGEKSARDDGLAIPLMFQPAFTDGVMYASWASTSGIVKNRQIQPEGLLFALDVRASADLTADDLREIVFIKEATGGDQKQTTKLIDGNEKLFNYTQIDTVVELTEITEADFTIDTSDKEHTGSAITPAVTPLTGLTVDVDYKVEYSNNVNAGTATITVTGIGAYTGTITKTFTIKEKAPAGKKGDIDGDNNVAIGDAIDVLRIIAEKGSYTDAQKLAADVDGDGRIGIGDAIEVLRIIAGKA